MTASGRQKARLDPFPAGRDSLPGIAEPEGDRLGWGVGLRFTNFRGLLREPLRGGHVDPAVQGRLVR